jgi:hypothetical protein
MEKTKAWWKNQFVKISPVVELAHSLLAVLLVIFLTIILLVAALFLWIFNRKAFDSLCDPQGFYEEHLDS